MKKEISYTQIRRMKLGCFMLLCSYLSRYLYLGGAWISEW